MMIDKVFRPTDAANIWTRYAPAATFRFYESSLRGLLTVLAYKQNEDDDYYIAAGTRLDVEQATELRDALNAFLENEQ